MKIFIELFREARSLKFLVVSATFIILVSSSNVLEEIIFKRLPGFDFYWTVAFIELLVFSVASGFERGCRGIAFAPLKASLLQYAGVAICLAVSQSIGKLAFKYLNYATGTMVRSSKLVPTMLVNVVWLRRSYTSLDWMAAVLLVMSAILMAVGEQAVEPAFNSLGFVLSAIYMAFNSLQGNLQDTILRDSDATVSESMFYSNTMGVAVVFCVLLYTGET
ncbi:hypothetical protein CYMTET_15313 [Cymbomonas tetramitiformis]|uniref:Uncharacterized protein n=1 Tax=Cymbomonas tetramitiformis TaxID=36881 RepID=A0AAE0GEP9_9CHLO|nr:hypothetical protein CYMTET_15313 [Cymbomonas tetramitiformis]